MHRSNSSIEIRLSTLYINALIAKLHIIRFAVPPDGSIN